jgi:predicted MPP superfamily phosphohydrolase
MLQAAIRAVNEANVDLLVITGDFIDHWPSTSDALTQGWLTQLRTKQSAIGPGTSTGIIASLGNHDYQKPESMSTVVRALEAASTLHTLKRV